MMYLLFRRVHKIIGFLVVLVVFSFTATAQQPLQLSLNDVFNIVRTYHPVARQANLIVDSAKAVRLSARGAFDPVLSVDNQQKTFDGKNYYFYTQGEVKIPTWYGIEVKAGMEDNGGDRLPLMSTPGRSSYTGISLPLLKNLLLDKRRAALEQSKLLIQQSEAEKANAYNDLLFDAAIAYWDWVKQYQVLVVIRNAIDVNEKRLNLVRRSFLGGDRAAIDTVEAITQLQNFQLQESEATYQFINRSYELSNFLWLENNQPYTLPTTVVPDTNWVKTDIPAYRIAPLEDALAVALQSHPKLQALGYKSNSLAVERRLKYQNLLPTLNVNYNFLQKGYDFYKGVGSNLFTNNYKYGFQLKVPLFLREARGEYKLANIKLQQNDLKIQQTKLEIENKVKSYHNEITALRTQAQILENAYENYQRLQRAEETKFSIGESSLFLINSREMKTLETLQKLLEVKTKFFKSLTALQWATGRL